MFAFRERLLPTRHISNRGFLKRTFHGLLGDFYFLFLGTFGLTFDNFAPFKQETRRNDLTSFSGMVIRKTPMRGTF